MVTFMGLCTMAYGEWMALRQEDLKRMLAYSTMGQVGEIFTVLGLGTWLAAAATTPSSRSSVALEDEPPKSTPNRYFIGFTSLCFAGSVPAERKNFSGIRSDYENSVPAQKDFASPFLPSQLSCQTRTP